MTHAMPLPPLAATAHHPLGCPRLLTRAVRQDSPLPRDHVHCPCSMGDTSQLAARAAELLPDKSASIICFCGVGGRVMGAKKTLEEAGYTGVLNAVRAALPPPAVPQPLPLSPLVLRGQGGLKDLVAAGLV